MRLFLSLIFVFLVTLNPVPVDAQSRANSCLKPSIKPQVSLRIKQARIKVSTGRSRKQLLSIRGRSGSSATGAGWQPVGLTLTSTLFQSQTAIQAQPMAGGLYCIQPAAITATIGFDKFKVFIAREYPRYSCEFNIIHEHEMTHVDIFKRTLREFTPRFQTRLNEAVRRLKPLTSRTPDRGARSVQRDLQRAMLPLINTFSRKLDQRNGRIDSPQSYLQILRRCKNW